MPITTRLMGGVGNQLFTIAAGYTLAKKKSTSFFITKDEFDGCGQGNHPSKYYDNIFSSILKKPCDESIVKHDEKQWTFYDLEPYFKDINFDETTVVFQGYFQSEKYFLNMKKDFKQLFAAPNYVDEYLSTRGYKERFPELFEPHTSCFIGVRRGDYISKASFHNPCGMDYYTKAIHACPATRYYVASDDMDWCRSHFIGPQYVFLDITDDLELLYLGTLFPKYIISNSSYHWWMSYLSAYADPIVIAPDKWIFGASAPRSAYDSIYRDDMIVIERTVETA